VYANGHVRADGENKSKTNEQTKSTVLVRVKTRVVAVSRVASKGRRRRSVIARARLSRSRIACFSRPMRIGRRQLPRFRTPFLHLVPRACDAYRSVDTTVSSCLYFALVASVSNRQKRFRPTAAVYVRRRDYRFFSHKHNGTSRRTRSCGVPRERRHHVNASSTCETTATYEKTSPRIPRRGLT